MNTLQKAPTSLTDLIYYFTKTTKKQNTINFKIYEMGRGIKQIDLELFTQFEAAHIPWPYPFIQSAWFALFFTSSQKSQDYHIWFLKLPLDEQGLLVQSARDAYLKQFFNQIIDQQTQKKRSVNQQFDSNLSTESPYGFKPSDEKMANINAIIKEQLKLLPSLYYQDVLHYLDHIKHQKDQWQTLGYQGLADLTCYMHNQYHNKNIESLLTDAVEQLPIEIFKALSTCLEHHQLSEQLQFRILSRAHKDNRLENITACLRAVSASSNKENIDLILKQALTSDYKDNIELLAVCCGRCWVQLKEPWLMLLFLEALAINSSGSEAFNIMVNDILFIPGMRDSVFEQFRNPNRSIELTIAIGDFYSSH